MTSGRETMVTLNSFLLLIDLKKILIKGKNPTTFFWEYSGKLYLSPGLSEMLLDME